MRGGANLKIDLRSDITRFEFQITFAGGADTGLAGFSVSRDDDVALGEVPVRGIW